MNRNSESESHYDDENYEHKDGEEINCRASKFSNNIENEFQKGSLWVDKR